MNYQPGPAPESAAETSPEQRSSLVGQFFSFLWENKIWWITPTVLILVLLAVVVYLTSGSSIAPFFYALF
ncbi:MAG: DUF5989 family protein [Planctomycetota bacterium]